MWCHRFKSGDSSTSHKPKPGCPHTETTPENIATVSNLLQENGKLSLHDIVNRTGLKMGVVMRIVKKELNLSCKVAKLIPTELTAAQKDTRCNISQSNLDLLQNEEEHDPEDFVRSIITGDETWIYTKEPKSRFESTVWLAPKSPHPKKAQTIPGNKKSMLTLFCDAQGVILVDFLEPKDKIDSTRYCQTLSKLKEALHKKRPHLWTDRKFWIHHDMPHPTCQERPWTKSYSGV